MTEKVGVSQICAKKAIIETATSRIFLACACLMSPALIFYMFEKLGKSPKRRLAKSIFELAVFVFSLMLALPSSIAIFPQTGMMKANEIEEHLRHNSHGERINAVYYNKGLWRKSIDDY